MKRNIKILNAIIVALIMVLILIASSCNPQSKKLQNNIDKQMDTFLFFIDNESIVYDFAILLNTTVAPFINYPGLYVRVELTDEQNEIIRKLDKQTWLNLLNSTYSDFAANLILYEIYEKDGTGLYVLDRNDNCCELWKKHDKDEELDYWEKHLDSVLCGVKCQNLDW